MKHRIIQFLLAILNTRWLNNTPCQYAFVGNVDAFSIENLRSEEMQRPGIRVKQIIEEAERFAACSINPMDANIIEVDGSVRPADCWERHEIREMIRGDD